MNKPDPGAGCAWGCLLSLPLYAGIGVAAVVFYRWPLFALLALAICAGELAVRWMVRHAEMLNTEE